MGTFFQRVLLYTVQTVCMYVLWLRVYVCVENGRLCSIQCVEETISL